MLTPVALEMFRGDTLEFDSTAKNANGITQDLTGARVWCTVKKTIMDPDEYAIARLDGGTGSVYGGVAIVDAPSGKVRVTLPPANTRVLPDGVVTLIYDVQVKYASGVIATIQIGTILVTPDVTLSIA